MAQYQFKSNYAFESGYYKLQVESLCKEIEFLQQELESTIEQIKEITKDFAWKTFQRHWLKHKRHLTPR